MYELTTLDNGLRVLTVPQPGAFSASIRIFINAGARCEKPESDGVSHFLEHLNFHGTRSFEDQQTVSKQIEGIGGILNAYTTTELTCFWCKVPPHHFDKSFAVLSEIVLTPRLRQEDIDRERGAVIEEINRKDDNPAAAIWPEVSQLLWPGQPIGYSVLGPKSNVERFGHHDLAGYHSQWYVPENLLVAVAGRVTHSQVVEAAKRAFEVAPSGHDLSRPAAVDQQEAAQIKLITRDTAQTQLVLAYRGVPSQHPDHYVHDVLDAVLGGGLSSRLFQNVRTLKGLAYSVGASASSYTDTGAFFVYAGLNNAKVELALEAIGEELRRIQDELVPEEELNSAKARNIEPFLFALESSDSLSNYFGREQLLFGRVRLPEERRVSIEAVTAKDLQRAARGLFVPDKSSLAILGPHQDSDPFLARIAA